MVTLIFTRPIFKLEIQSMMLDNMDHTISKLDPIKASECASQSPESHPDAKTMTRRLSLDPFLYWAG